MLRREKSAASQRFTAVRLISRVFHSSVSRDLRPRPTYTRVSELADNEIEKRRVYHCVSSLLTNSASRYFLFIEINGIIHGCFLKTISISLSFPSIPCFSKFIHRDRYWQITYQNASSLQKRIKLFIDIFEKIIPIFLSLSLDCFSRFDGMATEKFRDKIYLPFVETNETTSGKKNSYFYFSFIYSLQFDETVADKFLVKIFSICRNERYCRWILLKEEFLFLLSFFYF